MREDRLAAEYVQVIDDVRAPALALAEGRWRQGAQAATAQAATGLASAAGYLADAASAAREADACPTLWCGHIIQQANQGTGDRGVLEALGPWPGRDRPGQGVPGARPTAGGRGGAAAQALTARPQPARRITHPPPGGLRRLAKSCPPNTCWFAGTG
jgi:hypothetical protein